MALPVLPLLRSSQPGGKGPGPPRGASSPSFLLLGRGASPCVVPSKAARYCFAFTETPILDMSPPGLNLSSDLILRRTLCVSLLESAHFGKSRALIRTGASVIQAWFIASAQDMRFAGLHASRPLSTSKPLRVRRWTASNCSQFGLLRGLKSPLAESLLHSWVSFTPGHESSVGAPTTEKMYAKCSISSFLPKNNGLQTIISPKMQPTDQQSTAGP